MLIDATHPEETRVVVLRGDRVEEFDYESAAKKLLRGNIFLAKITRVEPSLQATFVEYGGNRHGFLAFNEIHPDYYQIPHSDRQFLLEQQMANNCFDVDDEYLDDGEYICKENSEVCSHKYTQEHCVENISDSQINNDKIDISNYTSLNPEDSDVKTLNTISSVGGYDQDCDITSKEQETLGLDAPKVENLPRHSESLILDTPSESVSAECKKNTTTSVEKIAQSVQNIPLAVVSDGERKLDSSAIGSKDSADLNVCSSNDSKSHHTISASVSSCKHVVGGFTDVSSDSLVCLDGPKKTEQGSTSLVSDKVYSTPCNSTVNTLSTFESNKKSVVDSAVDEVDKPTSVDVRKVHDVQAASQGSVIHCNERNVETSGSEDTVDETSDNNGTCEELSLCRQSRAQSYKIQEVIKRRQVVLVQVVKEERGNKGAALTTFLSLAGRYTVLMPNTARGGGISRKITSLQDRKRLKSIVHELDVPQGMGLIIRTAGASRTKQEIRRDFEHLLRLWENVRDLTLQSTAPSLVYEEGNLIKRSIRDLYSKEIDEVWVAGDDAYKEAKNFMRMLMPSHSKNIVKYDDKTPLFAKHRIEPQLDEMFSPLVQLKSGGYLVINQTEALVAVDVNSGKATKKFSIEETALNTNLEASEELARQLKLRDLAGLVVIDFIDMEEKCNNRAVERKFKECLRYDRARIQVGRISHFGLLEMSRQRLRTGVLEGSTMQCKCCSGTGIIRSTESVALAVLRSLEDHLMGAKPHRSPIVYCEDNVAMYLLNNKRNFVVDMETRYNVTIHIESSKEQKGSDYLIENMNGIDYMSPKARRAERLALNVDSKLIDIDVEEEKSREVISDDSERRNRRKRRRRGKRIEGEISTDDDGEILSQANLNQIDPTKVSAYVSDKLSERSDENSSRRRRGRRGGRRNRLERSNSNSVSYKETQQADFSQTETPIDSFDDDSLSEINAAPLSEKSEKSLPTIKNSKGTNTQEAHSIDDSRVPQKLYASQDMLRIKSSSQRNIEQDTPVRKKEFKNLESESEKVTFSDTLSTLQEDRNISSDCNIATTYTDINEAYIDNSGNQQEVEKSSRAHRGEPISTPPVLERIVIKPQQNALKDLPQKKPVRKGWWQQRFGSS